MYTYIYIFFIEIYIYNSFYIKNDMIYSFDSFDVCISGVEAVNQI